MSKTPSQVTTIGFFILTATVLLVAMLIAFGGSSWMKSTVTYTMHFNTSVKGLSPGSAVLFRGVKVGQVAEILYEERVACHYYVRLRAGAQERSASRAVRPLM